MRTPQGERLIEGSDILAATGRTPNTGGIGLDIAGVRLAVHNGRVQGSTSDINAGTVKLKDGSIESVKLARPAFTLEPSGRYRASADLSLGGGVLSQMKLGPAHASVVATSCIPGETDTAAQSLPGPRRTPRPRGNGLRNASMRSNSELNCAASRAPCPAARQGRSA